MAVNRVLLVAVLALSSCAEGAEGPSPKAHASSAIQYGEPRLLCRIANREIDESSGLACSRRNKDVFWTHNDSGGAPVIYAFNVKGEDVATVRLKIPRVEDCEDLATFTSGDKHYILLGDAGDNARSRRLYALHLIEEPELPADRKGATLEVDVLRTIPFVFDHGSEDGEGIAIDPESRTVYIATRNQFRRECHIYKLPLPNETPKAPLEAKRIATWPIRYGNALDISPDGLRAILGTYGEAYEFSRKPGETWAAAFRREPRALPIPKRDKGEGLCYGADGMTLYLTSEGPRPPLWEVPVRNTDNGK